MIERKILRIMEDILTNRNVEKLSLFIVSNFEVYSDLQYDNTIEYILNTRDNINIIVLINLENNQIEFIIDPSCGEHEEVIEKITDFIMEEL